MVLQWMKFSFDFSLKLFRGLSDLWAVTMSLLSKSFVFSVLSQTRPQSDLKLQWGTTA